jgi:hypothetical protein
VLRQRPFGRLATRFTPKSPRPTGACPCSARCASEPHISSVRCCQRREAIIPARGECAAAGQLGTFAVASCRCPPPPPYGSNRPCAVPRTRHAASDHTSPLGLVPLLPESDVWPKGSRRSRATRSTSQTGVPRQLATRASRSTSSFASGRTDARNSGWHGSPRMLSAARERARDVPVHTGAPVHTGPTRPPVHPPNGPPPPGASAGRLACGRTRPSWHHFPCRRRHAKDTAHGRPTRPWPVR